MPPELCGAPVVRDLTAHRRRESQLNVKHTPPWITGGPVVPGYANRMNERQRRYAIIGTGALGGYYGARLVHAGCDVHFLLRSDYAHVHEHGLNVESKEGDFSIPADRMQAYADAADMPKCDTVCVCLKATQNSALPDLLPKVLADDGVVLLIQNGLGLEADIGKIVGEDRVYGGLAFLCSNKIGPGHIRHLDYGRIKLGRWTADGQSAGVDPTMRQIKADFDRAGLPFDLADDLLLARWQKLVWNIPYNGLSVVLNATTDALMADPASRQLVEALMREVVAGAAAFGRTIEPAFVRKMLDDTVKMTPYRTSMKIDADEGRPMEVEAMFGNPVRAAAERGVELPRIEMLYRQLAFCDARNREGRG